MNPLDDWDDAIAGSWSDYKFELHVVFAADAYWLDFVVTNIASSVGSVCITFGAWIGTPEHQQHYQFSNQGQIHLSHFQGEMFNADNLHEQAAIDLFRGLFDIIQQRGDQPHIARHTVTPEMIKECSAQAYYDLAKMLGIDDEPA